MSAVPTVRVAAEHLHRVITSTWEAFGAPGREARLLADHLVEASLRGHDSHGVGMLPLYRDSLHSGALVLDRRAEVVADTGVVLTLDAGRGIGQVAAHDAMDLAIERARTHGAAITALRNVHHIGRIGHWAEQCAAGGFASIHLVSVPGDALVAPFGGSRGRMGTNPFCAGFPRAGDQPLIADFATSRYALGKTRVAFNSGVDVPEGTLLDADGRPTTDPGVMWRGDPIGTLLSAGEHKGSGLAILAELLAGAMSGGGVTTADSVAARNGIVNAMLSIVLDPAAFGAGDAQEQTEAFVAWVRDCPPVDGTDEVLLPGEPERRHRAQRSVDGVPVDATTWAQIRETALEAGLAPESIDPA